MASGLSTAAVDTAARELAAFIRSCKGRLLIVTGAGISTASNIPDYRGKNGAYVVNKDYKPILYQEFMARHASRQRYWARSMLGYGNVAHAQPNSAHRAVAQLEAAGYARLGVITQNVDSLHQKAGSRNVIELHGTLATVVCQTCKHTIDRREYQQTLVDMNPAWAARMSRATSLKKAATPSAEDDKKRASLELMKSLVPPAHDTPGENLTTHSFKSTTNVRMGPDGDAHVAPTAAARPDGDADIQASEIEYSTFQYPVCQHCSKHSETPEPSAPRGSLTSAVGFNSKGVLSVKIKQMASAAAATEETTRGILKPAVIFFGENIPAAVKQAVDDRLHLPSSSTVNTSGGSHRPLGILVLGSTLTTYSAFRIVRDFQRQRVRDGLDRGSGGGVWMVNMGRTRTDGETTGDSVSLALLQRKIEMPVESLLPRTVAELTARA